MKLSQERVTDEDSPVSFLATNHPALNTPNKITDADFKGWVQERGVYFPNQWDEHFTPILACNDPGEAPKTGSLLIAQYGKKDTSSTRGFPGNFSASCRRGYLEHTVCLPTWFRSANEVVEPRATGLR